MSQPIAMPDEAQRKAFVERLALFRATLPPDQQQMLDIMVITTFAPREEADVQGYQWFWSQWGPNGPGWYTYGYLRPWTDSGYQQTATGTAYGLQAGSNGLYLQP